MEDNNVLIELIQVKEFVDGKIKFIQSLNDFLHNLETNINEILVLIESEQRIKLSKITKLNYDMENESESVKIIRKEILNVAEPFISITKSVEFR